MLRLAAKLPELSAMLGLLTALVGGFVCGVPAETVLLRAIGATIAFGILGMIAGLLLAAVHQGEPQEERVRTPTN